jgi:hypothetical protein
MILPATECQSYCKSFEDFVYRSFSPLPRSPLGNKDSSARSVKARVKLCMVTTTTEIQGRPSTDLEYTDSMPRVLGYLDGHPIA